ncbi:MAG: hypothetical protein ACT4O1_10385 [Gemmatimonadota bacterium]
MRCSNNVFGNGRKVSATTTCNRVCRAVAVALFAALALLGRKAIAQEVKPGGREAITIRGILSASFFMQDAIFGLGNGQKAQFVQEAFEEDKWWHGGDARNMRLTLAFAGPEVTGNWKANATFEMDFFGPFASGGNFGDEQPLPRLRLAFADLTNGRTTFRVGQDWALTLGNIPVSTSHIGFPLGWGTGGFIGWRFLGLQLHHTLTRADAATTAQVKLGVYKGSWSDEPNPPPAGAVPSADDGPSAGESGLPQMEARFDLTGKAGEKGTWGAYAVGHYDRKDMDGAGEDDPDVADLSSWALEGGARVASGRFTLHGNAYVGKAMGHHFANIIQFRDVKGWGAWAQLGFNVTKRWSVWGWAGTDNPDNEDESGRALDRTESVQYVPMLRFQSGQLAFGLEWLHSKTDWVVDVALPTQREEQRSGNQLIFSAVYTF